MIFPSPLGGGAGGEVKKTAGFLPGGFYMKIFETLKK